MAKNDAPSKPKRTRRKRRKDNDLQWLNLPVNGADAKKFHEKVLSDSQFFTDAVWALLANSDGLSITQRDEDTFTAFVFFSDDSDGTQKPYGISSWSGSPETAFIGALFKYVHILECGENMPDAPPKDDFDLFS